MPTNNKLVRTEKLWFVFFIFFIKSNGHNSRRMYDLFDLYFYDLKICLKIRLCENIIYI